MIRYCSKNNGIFKRKFMHICDKNGKHVFLPIFKRPRVEMNLLVSFIAYNNYHKFHSICLMIFHATRIKFISSFLLSKRQPKNIKLAISSSSDRQ
jgi:hypothetical protein